MTELEPTRENDALVAEAMGWTAVSLDAMAYQPTPLWRGRPPLPKRQSRYEIPDYLTDPAQVVPMMLRLGELQSGPIDLSPPGAGRHPTCWRLNIWRRIRVFDGETANLAVAAALLDVWEARKEGGV